MLKMAFGFVNCFRNSIKSNTAAKLTGATAIAALSLNAPSTFADVPNVTSGYGITVSGTSWLSPRTLIVGISTPDIATNAVNGPHEVRITLPVDYFQNTNTRYPVLYLLHGGAGGSSRQWTSEGGAAEFITDGKPIITVSPDGGKVGWYTNWINTSAGAQSWEHFHLQQLIPWIDANVRTIANKSGRAIAGLSMGGFGAIHYAQQRPDLFAYAASFSGALDLEDQAVRAVIIEQELENGFPADGAFGSPIWPFDTVWIAQNPLHRANDLQTVEVALYCGGGSDPVEQGVAATTLRMHNALNAAGIPHFYWNYGIPGPSAPFGADGNHNFSSWNFALNDVLPKMLAVLSPPLTDIVIDNSSAGFSASVNWATSSYSADKYGGDYRFRPTAAISDQAVWSFNINTAGNYDIYAWWSHGSNRATNASYRLPDNSNVTVNQQVNGGQWNLLGTKYLTPGTNTVKLSCWTTSGYVVIADAVKLVAQ